jgi:hypothetical protein
VLGAITLKEFDGVLKEYDDVSVRHRCHQYRTPKSAPARSVWGVDLIPYETGYRRLLCTRLGLRVFLRT